MTESVAKSEKKILSLDLDTNAIPKQIILAQSELKNSKPHDSSGKLSKIKKANEQGSDKPKKAKASGDTSIIDSILKKNKVDPVKLSTNHAHQKDKSIPEQKKKMILDLNSGEQIITADISPTAKISNIVTEPKLQFVPEKPKATIILKSEAKKQKQVGGNITPPETQFKLDTLFSIDNSLSQTQAGQPAYAPPEYNQIFESPPYPPPITSTGTTPDLLNKSHPIIAAPPAIDYAKELTEIDAQLAKVRAKLAKRGPEPKYLKMQTKLEERRAKYIRRQQRQEAVSSNNKAKPLINALNTSTIDTKISESVTPATTNLGSGLAQLFKRKTPSANSQTNNTQSDLLDEVNQELRKAKDMLTNIEKTSANAPTQQTTPRKVIKEQGTSIFAVPSELTSMREKKEHLLTEQKKITDRIAHRQKQIDKIKTWQREVERMQELHAEKQRIFELQQDLKRLERQQYEQDQKLKGQMYQIRKMAHSKSNELKRLDMIDTFKAVKQRSQSAPIANNTQTQAQTQPNTQTHRTEINSSPATTQSGFGGKLRAAINGLFSGERVMFTKNNTIPAPIKQVEPQVPLIITEDTKSGLEYRTPTPVNNDTALETSSTLPAQKIVDVINMAKQIDAKSSEPETQISQYQVNVFRDYFCDKVGISKKGITKCFDLMPNKDENHTAILVNAYKELCDEIRFSG